MIGTSSFISFGIMILFGILFPVGIVFWWILRHKENKKSIVKAMLIGAATWWTFAIILETAPKYILFNPAFSIGKFVTENVIAYTVIGALLAGIFEETGRFLAFKFVLKNENNREIGISHGIGHGGLEALYILVVTGATNIFYSIMVNTGGFQEIITKVTEAGLDPSSYIELPELLASLTPLTVCATCLERISAIILHVSLSIMVFYGVKKSKIWMYPLAILLHALFDVPAALYQFGVFTNLWVAELIFLIEAVIIFIFTYKYCYMGYKTDIVEDNFEEKDKEE